MTNNTTQSELDKHTKALELEDSKLKLAMTARIASSLFAPPIVRLPLSLITVFQACKQYHAKHEQQAVIQKATQNKMAYKNTYPGFFVPPTPELLQESVESFKEDAEKAVKYASKVYEDATRYFGK